MTFGTHHHAKENEDILSSTTHLHRAWAVRLLDRLPYGYPGNMSE